MTCPKALLQAKFSTPERWVGYREGQERRLLGCGPGGSLYKGVQLSGIMS